MLPVPFVHVQMAPLQTVGVQARTEARDASGSDPNDLELEAKPQVRYDAIWDHGDSHFVALYAPRFILASTDRDDSQGLAQKTSFLQLHQVGLGAELERRRYHVSSYGNFAYGPITTTALLITKPWLGEELPAAPGVIIPAKYGAEFTLLFAQAQIGVPIHLTRRLSLIPFVAYNAFGGADSPSRDTIAMVRGPGASLTLEAKATREDTFKSKVGGGQAQAFFGGDRIGASFVRAEVEERYSHKWTERTQSEIAFGGSFAEDQFTGARLFPTAEVNTVIMMHTRALDTKLAIVGRVQPWLDPLSGDLEQRPEGIGAANFTFYDTFTLRAQGGYAQVLPDPNFSVPVTYSIAAAELGGIWKFNRQWSADATGRFSRQLFSNSNRDGRTDQTLITIGLTYTPHDWKM